MSFVDVGEDVLASPERARSLLTVRAAISLARLVDAPRFLALSRMCSYCRSRLGLLPAGIGSTPASGGKAAGGVPRSGPAPTRSVAPLVPDRADELGLAHLRAAADPEVARDLVELLPVAVLQGVAG